MKIVTFLCDRENGNKKAQDNGPGAVANSSVEFDACTLLVEEMLF